MKVELRRLSPDDPDAARLFEQSDRYAEALYPPGSNHLDSPDALRRSNAALFGAYIGVELVGCAAVKVLDDDGRYGEIKRLYVVERYRGRGCARALIAHLESHLKAAGVEIARLETGVRQSEALALYAKLGYAERGPFGRYAPDPLSVFMEKRLD